MSQTKQFNGNFSTEDILKLFQNKKDPEGLVKVLLIVIGVVLTPITLIGMLWFYVRSYNRHLRPNKILPVLWPMLPITQVSMVIGGIIIWAIVYLLFQIANIIFHDMNFGYGVIFGYLAVTIIFTFTALYKFDQWRNRTAMSMMNDEKFGSAKEAHPEEYLDLKMNPKGIYLGDHDLKFADQGHILSKAGPRSGKFTNLIASNLLGAGNYEGSWVCIDVKGEIFAVTSAYQSSIGQNVIKLNPWNLLEESKATYNPLDLLDPNDEDALIDDAGIIAQMIVPDQPGDKDPFWRNRARSWIKGMIVYLMLSDNERTLTQIWKWLRSSEIETQMLYNRMAAHDNEVVKGTGNEILAMMVNEKGYSSVISSCQDATDFLSSPALQRSLKSSNFNIKDLSAGKTTLYVVIPADKLESQSQWLRLVVTTSLLSVVRNKNKRVTFVLDEFPQMGKMDIILKYMGLSSGYNVTLWPIVQSLQQLKGIYGEAWETFIGAAAVRHYFGVSDNFSADYISHASGVKTFQNPYYNVSQGQQQTARALFTPDEIKRISADQIFIQVNQRNFLRIDKAPYYLDPELVERAEENPYSPVPLPDPKTLPRITKMPLKS